MMKVYIARLNKSCEIAQKPLLIRKLALIRQTSVVYTVMLYARATECTCKGKRGVA